MYLLNEQDPDPWPQHTDPVDDCAMKAPFHTEYVIFNIFLQISSRLLYCIISPNTASGVAAALTY